MKLIPPNEGELQEPLAKGADASFCESFIGMLAGWLALQVGYLLLAGLMVFMGGQLLDSLMLLCIWSFATGVVCLIAWLTICWPATLMLRSRLHDGRISVFAGVVLGLVAGAAGGFFFVGLWSGWRGLDGMMPVTWMAAGTGTVAGGMIAWRAWRSRLRREFFEQHGMQ